MWSLWLQQCILQFENDRKNASIPSPKELNEPAPIDLRVAVLCLPIDRDDTKGGNYGIITHEPSYATIEPATFQSQYVRSTDWSIMVPPLLF